MPRRIESATFDPAGTLTIRFSGSGRIERTWFDPVPRARGSSFVLRWSGGGVVLDGADPVGLRFSFGDAAVAGHVVEALRVQGRITVQVLGSGRPTDAERGTAGARPDRPEPARADLSVLSDPRPGRFLVLALKRWAPGAQVPAVAALTREQIDRLMASSTAARVVVDTVARSWGRYAAAGGADPAVFEQLTETVLTQWTWGNPSAPAKLRIAARPDGWGLYSTGADARRWYDENGHPLLGEHGGPRDRGHRWGPGPAWAGRGGAEDPALALLLSALAADTLDEMAVAQGYVRTIDLLVPAVMQDWPFLRDLGAELVGMVRVLIWFIAASSIANILIVASGGAGRVAKIGRFLLLVVRRSGWILQISFVGNMARDVNEAGRELLLVRRGDRGQLDELSRRHLDRAVVLVRGVITAMVSVFLLESGRRLGPPAAKAATEATRRATDAAGRFVRELGEGLEPSPALRLAFAGEYGGRPAPSRATMAMSGLPEQRGTGGGRSGRGATPREPVARPAPTWRRHEAAVLTWLRRVVPKIGWRFFMARKDRVTITTLLAELAAHVRQMAKEGRDVRDVPTPDPTILNKTRRQFVKGTALEAEYAAVEARLLRETAAAERRRNASTGDRRAYDEASADLAEATKAWHEWSKIADVRIGDAMPDAVLFEPSRGLFEVVDPTLRWARPNHNLKTATDVLSLQKLLPGWQGTGIDVGTGRFQSRLVEVPSAPPAPPPAPVAK